MIWLALASLLPGVVGATLLFIYQYQEGRAEQKQDTIQTARALAQAVDLHLLRAQAAGEVLATNEALTERDLKQLHEDARKLVNRVEMAANVVLRDRNEQLVLNALVPYGAPLPVQPSREHVRRVFFDGKASDFRPL